jgi:hypothetical protein
MSDDRTVKLTREQARELKAVLLAELSRTVDAEEIKNLLADLAQLANVELAN